MSTRITVSLPDDLVADVNAAVASGGAASVSAYVAQALRERVGRETLVHVLAEVRHELGPAAEDETQWALDVLGVPGA